MRDEKVIILMGSETDLKFGKKIAGYLEDFEIDYKFRVASAHFTPSKVLGILEEYEDERVVYITVAGKLDFLSGFVAANTTKPVLSCPPQSERFHELDLVEKIGIFMSQNLPSGASFGLTVGPENAALASAAILATGNRELRDRISEYKQRRRKNRIESADERLKNS